MVIDGQRVAAKNMTTCQVEWQTPEGMNVDIWKAGTGLLQRDRGRNTLSGLRSPS